MAFYENTIIAKQDLAEKDLKTIKEKYQEIINSSSGKLIKTEEWGLLNLANKIKNYKNMYVKGIISKLPWEAYVKSNTEKYQTSEGYIQNEEQNTSSIWNRIQPKDD